MKVMRQAVVVCILISIFLVSGCRSIHNVPADEAAEAWYNLGNAYTELGRHDDAVKAFIKARQLNPELVGAGFNLARIQIMQKKYDDSLAQLDELIKLDPQNRILLETKAWVMHLKGDDAAALGIYDEVLSIFEDSRNALYNSALLLSEIENYEGALTRLKHFVTLYPDEMSAVFEIAKTEAFLEHNDEALLWLDKYLSEQEDDYQAIELLGDINTAEKRYAEAVVAYRRITGKVSDTPSDSGKSEELPSADMTGRVYFKIAEILLVDMEDSEGGLAALKESIDQGWKDKDGWARVLSHTEAEWYEQAVLIIPAEEKSPSEEDSTEGE